MIKNRVVYSEQREGPIGGEANKTHSQPGKGFRSKRNSTNEKESPEAHAPVRTISMPAGGGGERAGEKASVGKIGTTAKASEITRGV